MTATNAPSLPTEMNAERKAHEPSMDDILASIRRIIADDDVLPLSRRARAASASSAAPPAPVSAPAPAPVAAAPPAADSFFGLGQRLSRQTAVPEASAIPQASPAPQASSASQASAAPEAPVAPPAPLPAAMAPKTPMLKLRDFAAGLNPMRDPASKEVRPKTPEAALPDMDLRPSLPESDKLVEPPKASVVTLVQPTPNNVESRMKVASLAFRAPAFTSPPARNDEPPRLTPAPETAPEKPADARVEAGRPDASPPPEPAAETVRIPQLREEKAEQTLLSPASGAKIGASFEALAESMLMRDPQMVERLTREMLRPMLKAWLDDNLPIVVERLVRAEIERVARGRG